MKVKNYFSLNLSILIELKRKYIIEIDRCITSVFSAV